MAAKYDSNLELNPNALLGAVVIFVALAFTTVYVIVSTGDAKPAPAAAAE